MELTPHPPALGERAEDEGAMSGPLLGLGPLDVAAQNDREDHVAAGEVSVEEARAMLRRFIHSHWYNKNPAYSRARFSIPADPLRDDDIRLGAFISRSAKAFAEVDALRAEVARLRGEPADPISGRELLAALDHVSRETLDAIEEGTAL